MLSAHKTQRLCRYPIAVSLTYEVRIDGQEPRRGRGQTFDLGLTGASLDLPERFAPGTALSFGLDCSPPLAVVAKVAWTAPHTAAGTIRHGVAFLELTREAEETLQALIVRSGTHPSRLPLPQPWPALAQATLEVRVLEIGAGGACVEHLQVLRPNAACALNLPAASGGLSLPARVVRSRVIASERAADGEQHLRYETGIRFELTPEQDNALAELLRALALAGGQPLGQLLIKDGAL